MKYTPTAATLVLLAAGAGFTAGCRKEAPVDPVLHMPDGGIKEDIPHIAITIADLVAGARSLR